MAQDLVQGSDSVSYSLQKRLYNIRSESKGIFAIYMAKRDNDGVTVHLTRTFDVEKAIKKYVSGEDLQLWLGKSTSDKHKILEFGKHELKISYIDPAGRFAEEKIGIDRDLGMAILTEIYFPVYNSRPMNSLA